MIKTILLLKMTIEKENKIPKETKKKKKFELYGCYFTKGIK